jgi:hypothetical protein
MPHNFLDCIISRDMHLYRHVTTYDHIIFRNVNLKGGIERLSRCRQADIAYFDDEARSISTW